MSSMVSKPTVVACHARATVSAISRTSKADFALRQASRDVVPSAAHSDQCLIPRIVEIAKVTATAFSACVTIGLHSSALAADQIALRLPVSSNKDIAQVQEVMLETWSVVDDSFFDVNTLVRALKHLSTDSKPRCGSCVRVQTTLRGMYSSCETGACVCGC
jgi:hypothetical protein